MSAFPTHSESRRTSRNRMSVWASRIVLVPLISAVVLLAVGYTYQSVATASDARAFPPPGEMIDVGGYRLHVHVMGEGHDGPTVLLENGGTGIVPQWGWVQPDVATFARVVAYDRPGTGWSEAPLEPLDAEGAVRALHRVLEQVGVEGPYVLVGHSMGGLMLRVFAQTYPDEVAGMVLVDPRDLTWQGVYAEGEGDVPVNFFRTLAVLSRFGVTRLLGVAAQGAEGLPPQQYGEAVAIGSTAQYAEGFLAEARYGDSAITFLNAHEQQHDWPLIVLSAGAPDQAFSGPARSGFTTLHARLADSLSSSGGHRIVDGAGHLTIVTHEEHARTVSHTVREMVELVRAQ
jgi:pimeloyl-ACP methyl ester carboxylesterase